MVRFGVVGAGNIAHTFCQAVLGTSGSLEAIASRDLNKALAYQKKYSIRKAYGRYQELYQDPDIDCIYLATPHGLHYEQMMEILDYNKSIICEKAFTLNASQAEKVFAKAKQKQCFVMEAMWTRFLPNILHLKQQIKNGVIGSITRLEVDFCFVASIDDNHRLVRPDLGGGALLDVGIYPITLANLLLGVPNAIESTVDLHCSGVDMRESITYYYPNAVAQLTASFVDEKAREARIFGEKGWIKVPQFWSSETTLIYDLNDILVNHYSFKHRVNGFEYQIAEAIKMIELGECQSPLMPHRETLEILRQMDVLRSMWNMRYPIEK